MGYWGLGGREGKGEQYMVSTMGDGEDFIPFLHV